MYTHERGKGSTLAIPISGDGTKKRPTEDKKMEGLVKRKQRETVGSREQEA